MSRRAADASLRLGEFGMQERLVLVDDPCSIELSLGVETRPYVQVPLLEST